MLGPDQYDTEDNSYYLWDKDEDFQVLFNFSEEVVLTTVQFHFYANRNESVGLPKLRVSLVNDSFRVSDTLDPNAASLTVDPTIISPDTNERRSMELELRDASTQQVLLRVDEHKRYALALTEIKFCSAGKLHTQLSHAGRY